ncbi:MAG TPA: hypothetical protein DCZ95_00370 [Verrucomicrobia bacterium]|nr:hypothetical protein [Verrucomicrobiota bacterium]
MPIYEYNCKKCRKAFEKLVPNSQTRPECPTCGSKNVEKLFSTFSASVGGPSFEPPCASQGCSSGSCSSGHCPYS